MTIKVLMPNKFRFKIVPTIKNVMLTKDGDVHYIGGTDVLPAPLESSVECEMISKLGSDNDSYAKSMLIEHNLRLVVYIAKKFDNTGVGVEDLISIGTIGLLNQ